MQPCRPAPARALALPALVAMLAACGGAPVVPIRPAATDTAGATATPAPTPTPTASCTPASAIAAWPLAQRAAQLVVAPALNGQMQALVPVVRQGVGGLLILGSAPADLRQQASSAQAAAAVPLLVMADQEGGAVQRLGSLVSSLPSPRAMAQTMTAAQVQSAVAQVGTQMTALGVTMDLAPVLDLDAGAGPSNTDPDGTRSFSLDANVASTYGLAFAHGLASSGVLAVVKHFPGLGGAGANTDVGPASTLPLATLQQAGLVPFRSAVAAGLPAVMVSNANVPGLTNGVPASLSAAAITDLLRIQLGFHGLVLTDSLSAGAITADGDNVPQATVAAITAGANMVLFGSTLTPAETALLSPANVAATVTDTVNALTAAVQSGRLSESRLDEAVLHVLSAKHFNPCG